MVLAIRHPGLIFCEFYEVAHPQGIGQRVELSPRQDRAAQLCDELFAGLGQAGNAQPPEEIDPEDLVQPAVIGLYGAIEGQLLLYQFIQLLQGLIKGGEPGRLAGDELFQDLPFPDQPEDEGQRDEGYGHYDPGYPAGEGVGDVDDILYIMKIL